VKRKILKKKKKKREKGRASVYKGIPGLLPEAMGSVGE
jgi:hypothetical protein